VGGWGFLGVRASRCSSAEALVVEDRPTTLLALFRRITVVSAKGALGRTAPALQRSIPRSFRRSPLISQHIG
jgi:hypothetical protein